MLIHFFRCRLAACCAALCLVLCLALPQPSFARDGANAECRAWSDSMLPVDQALARLQWTCGEGGWQDGRAVTWLRFDDIDRADPPLEFASRIAVFGAITIAALDADGGMRAHRYLPRNAEAVRAGPVFRLPLPEARPDTLAYVVAIEKAHSVTIASEAALYRDTERAQGSLTAVLLLCVVTGVLLMPLLFDCLFYIVLRDRFVLLHAGMTLSMIAYALFGGGVVTAFAELPIALIAILTSLSWALGASFAGFFLVSFLGKDAIDPRLRRWVLACAWWTILVPGFAGLQLHWTQSFDNALYFYAFLPVVPSYMAAIVQAVARGSRSARFLLVSWLPVILASVERLLRGIGLYSAPNSIDAAMFFAIAFEVSVMALAVADRFIAIRLERDRARTQARMLSELTERDSLTGLFNRRMVRDRFKTLRLAGFTSLAVLDLDNFKDINDRFGHAIGDDVLRAVATALQPDDDTLAVRLGGEEFALLLRGRNPLAEAERRRQAIAAQVAQTVALDRPVTASMGVIVAPLDAMPDAGFEALYARADQLLYEAKTAGRNRTISEKIRAFVPRRRERRAA